MKNIGIQTPCSENWNNMTPTEQGVFCQKCVRHVYDFTNRSNDEIKQTLRSLLGQPVCARLTHQQEASLNAELRDWSAFRSKRAFQGAFVFSLIVVFGLTLFSCESEQEQQQIEHIQSTALKAVLPQLGETEAVQHTTAVEQTETLPPPATAEYDLEPVSVEAVYEYPTIDIPEIQVVSTLPFEGHLVGELVIRKDYVNYLEEAQPEVDENGRPYPAEYTAIAFPNPATTETTLEIAVPEKERFEIVLCDMNGRILQTILKGKIERGHFQQAIDLRDLAPGTYIIAIASKRFSETIKVSKL